MSCGGREVWGPGRISDKETQGWGRATMEGVIEMRFWGKRKILGRDKERGRAKGTKRGETLFIHSFNKYLMSVYYTPGTVPGAEDIVAMETG